MPKEGLNIQTAIGTAIGHAMRSPKGSLAILVSVTPLPESWLVSVQNQAWTASKQCQSDSDAALFVAEQTQRILEAQHA